MNGGIEVDCDELFALLLNVRALCPAQADEEELKKECIRAVSKFYNVDDITKLGHGNIDVLLSKLDEYERCDL